MTVACHARVCKGHAHAAYAGRPTQWSQAKLPGLDESLLLKPKSAVMALQERVRYEAEGLREQHRLCPEHVPTVYHYDPQNALLVMEYLPPPHVILRKAIVQVCLTLPCIVLPTCIRLWWICPCSDRSCAVALLDCSMALCVTTPAVACCASCLVQKHCSSQGLCQPCADMES